MIQDTTLEKEEKKKEKIGKQEKEVIGEIASLDKSLKEYEDLISSFIQVKNEQEDELDKIREVGKEISSAIYKVTSEIESQKSNISILEKRNKGLLENIAAGKEDVKRLEKQIKEIEKETPSSIDTGYYT